MASLYPKKRSPYWFMETTDATGKTSNRSTKLRRDSVEQTRRARQLCALRTADELESPKSRKEDWRWVGSWLRLTFTDRTLQRYRQAWFALSQFFAAQGIITPRQVQRECAESYIAWRMNPSAGSGVRAACKNTALLDLKVGSRVMREAVLRKLAAANPFLQLGFKKDAVKHRPDILPNERKIIEQALKSVTDRDMIESWRMAQLYGRRITETRVALADISLERKTITFRNKGALPKTKLLHASLRPHVKQWQREGRTHNFEFPPNFSKKWCKFFDRIGLPHITFHSARVRAATKLMEKGVHPEIARDFIDHSNELTHRIYIRARPDHHRAALDALDSKRS